MFASRAVRPLTQASRQQIRRYASEAPPKKSGGGALTYTLLATAAAGLGYYFYTQPGSLTPGDTVKRTPVAAAGSSGPAKKAFTGGDQGFVPLVLEKVDNINHNTKRFRFKLPEDDAVSGLSVASALLTKYKGPEMEKPAVRPYTPVSDEDDAGFVDLIVKKYPGGPMSEHFHDMKPGQSLDFKGPIPKYPWSTNKHDHIALIAGGTGITPMYQLCRAIFKNPQDNTKVTLVFGNIKEEDILLKHEFEELEKDYPNRFRAFYTLDQPPEKWQQGAGHITKELLNTVLPKPDAGNVKVFVCGPPGLYKAISGTKKSPADQGELSGILKELGYSQDQVYKF